jgi:serine phosphatase RsbU (regulator of sigma subunit)
MPVKKAFRLKNEMMGANFIANFVAVFFVGILIAIVEAVTLEDLHPHIKNFDMFFTTFCFLSIAYLTYRYEKPIRKCIPALMAGASLDPNLLDTARRRILNEPFVLLFMDICVWMMAAILYPMMFFFFESGPGYVHRALYISISTGCVTVIVAFFLLEHLLQKRFIPVFFPNGGLDRFRGTLRIRIRTRLGALLFACNLVPLLSILDLVFRLTGSTGQSEAVIGQLRLAATVNTIIFIIVGFFLAMLVNRNLTLPFKEIIHALKNIKRGNFDVTARVMSNDEFGYTSEIINDMTEGLRERNHLRESLELAMEVQQNLMPKTDPFLDGIQIAGTSIYCEQTGGDYYDYLIQGADGGGEIGIMVGDVSGHGIPSALLMTSGRAFLRQRAALAGGISQIVSDVNREICRDVEASGRFMTLFFSQIDRTEKQLKWVNAGHEPAFLFDPKTAEFRELRGGGLPLGVFENTAYSDNRTPLQAGWILIVGTDGIWECRNPGGEMFGKNRFKQIIKEHSQSEARQMVSQIIQALEDFRESAPREDDITLVIVKIQKL